MEMTPTAPAFSARQKEETGTVLKRDWNGPLPQHSKYFECHNNLAELFDRNKQLNNYPDKLRKYDKQSSDWFVEWSDYMASHRTGVPPGPEPQQPAPPREITQEEINAAKANCTNLNKDEQIQTIIDDRDKRTKTLSPTDGGKKTKKRKSKRTKPKRTKTKRKTKRTKTKRTKTRRHRKH